MQFIKKSSLIKNEQLKQIEEQAKEIIKNSPEDVLNRYQDALRVKWNDFASLLNDSTVYKLPTTEKPLIDISL